MYLAYTKSLDFLIQNFHISIIILLMQQIGYFDKWVSREQKARGAHIYKHGHYRVTDTSVLPVEV